ncbi:unnamed protein product [Brassica napus]|uniref:(rape) hypothetical protein n=1 Tax=Brassica napus TaxID=3708 RepID=A0A816I105_BRANA|nr:unnamed protein product [Brassica napus]
MAMEAYRRKTCRRRLNLRLRAREPRRKNQGPQRQQLEPRAPIRKALWFKVRYWSLRVRDVQCMDELIFLVLEVDCRTVSPRLLTDFGFPCSKGGPQTIQNLTKQFHPSLTEEEKIKKKKKEKASNFSSLKKVQHPTNQDPRNNMVL